MKLPSKYQPHRIHRRAFLRGAAGVSLALPFLESLPERSAWAADESPVFGLFICATGGVVPQHFFPEQTGPLTPESLGSAGKATSELAAHASRLLFLSGLNFPPLLGGDAHIDGFCSALTGRPSQPPIEGDRCAGSNCAMGSGPSADVVIASRVHPEQLPLVLALGNARNGYAAERLSFIEAGQLAPASYNPYELYEQLIGLTSAGTGATPARERAAKLLLESRGSVHDLVREELADLKAHPRLSSADRQRLDLHLQSIRDAEVAMGGMGNEAVEACSSQGLNVSALEALQTFAFNPRRVEEIGQLYLSLVALAFACNYRRTASLQWGDPYDRTLYDVPSNARGWPFIYISHRMESDAASGNDDPLAERAHMEVDAVRMRSLAIGLDHFEARGLGDKCFVLWTNHYASNSHSNVDVPHILWGSAGGYLKQGEFLYAGGVRNGRLHNTLITAAIRHTGETMEDFGENSPGQLQAILA